jgi:hypothetical protein
MRDMSMESAEAELDMHSPEAAELRKKNRAAMKSSLGKGANVSDTAPGNNRTVQGTLVPPGTVEPTKK